MTRDAPVPRTGADRRIESRSGPEAGGCVQGGAKHGRNERGRAFDDVPFATAWSLLQALAKSSK